MIKVSLGCSIDRYELVSSGDRIPRFRCLTNHVRQQLRLTLLALRFGAQALGEPSATHLVNHAQNTHCIVALMGATLKSAARCLRNCVSTSWFCGYEK